MDVEFFNKCLLAKGLTLRRLALLADVSVGHLSDARRGKKKMEMDSWFCVALVLGTTVDRLFAPAIAEHALGVAARERLLSES